MHTITKLNLPVFSAMFLCLGAIAVTVFFAKQDQAENLPVFPKAAAAIKDSVAINIDGSDKVTTLIKVGATDWFVGELDGYPAQISKVKAMTSAIEKLRLQDIVAANPARYIEFGTEDISVSSPAKSVSFVGLDGAISLGFIMGMQQDKEGFAFLRKIGSKNVLKVKGTVPFDNNPLWWVNDKILEITPSQILKISMTDLEKTPNEQIDFIRSNETEDFAVSANFTFKGSLTPAEGAKIANGLSQLYFGKVKLVSLMDKPMETIFKIDITLADGSLTGLNLVKVGQDEVWLQVYSSDALVNARHQGWIYNTGWDKLLNILPPPEEEQGSSLQDKQ